jgi:acyl-CoA reductase-like NAD-dependent aldehyde dehydrogenase
MIFGTDIGAELVRHPAIQAVGFTGSLRGGRRSGSWRSSVRSQSRSLRKCRPLTR